MKNGPFPLRTKNQQKPKTNSLTGKAPYKFESGFLQWRVGSELDFRDPRITHRDLPAEP
jgi:hypothetical protein